MPAKMPIKNLFNIVSVSLSSDLLNVLYCFNTNKNDHPEKKDKKSNKDFKI